MEGLRVGSASPARPSLLVVLCLLLHRSIPTSRQLLPSSLGGNNHTQYNPLGSIMYKLGPPSRTLPGCFPPAPVPGPFPT